MPVEEPKLPVDVRVNNVFPSLTDHRDIPAEAVIENILGENPIPDQFDLGKTTQKNQGQKPKCVGCSSCSVKEGKEKEEGNLMEFDDDWMYEQCKLVDGFPSLDGTFLRTAMLIMKNIGCLPKGGDPNDAPLIAKYRIKGFVRVEPTPEAIKRAVYTLGAVMVGFHGANGGWQTGVIRPPMAGETIWGHAVKEHGYFKEFIIGQNSWGEFWGDSGLFKAPLNYTPFEAWAILKDLPNNWQELLPDPTNKPAYFFGNNLGPSQKLNPETKILQECLIYDGELHREEVGANLGYYGPKTTAAVKVYQKRHGIPATGFVGILTRLDLNKRFAIN